MNNVKFVEFQCALLNLKNQDLGLGESNEYEGPVKINLFEVVAFRADVDPDEHFILDSTFVYLKSGESFLLRIHIDEFDKLMQEYVG